MGMALVNIATLWMAIGADMGVTRPVIMNAYVFSMEDNLDSFVIRRPEQYSL